MSLPPIKISGSDVTKARADVLVLPVFEGELNKKKKGRRKSLTNVLRPFRGTIEDTARAEKISGKKGENLSIHTHGKLGATRLLLLGLGKEKDAGARRLAGALATAARHTRSLGKKKLVVALPESFQNVSGLRAAAEGLGLGAYHYDDFLTDHSDKKRRNVLADIRVVVDDTRDADTKAAFAEGLAIAEATCIARDLVNEPAGTLTPSRLAEVAKGIAKDHGLTVKIHEKKDLEKLNMGMFLGVSAGSDQPPKMIELSYRPKGAKKEDKGIAFVGKGITFDSGGYDLKGAAFMGDMKIDMAGAAAAISAMRAVAAIAPPFPVTCYAGAAENLVNGSAYKPGDILHSRKGVTVEINNTDAEGRLVLGDVLTYAVDQGHEAIVDLATLTGACMVALGPYTVGCFSNDDDLAGELLGASRRAGEDLWRMPLNESLREQLKSTVADMKNTGERFGGAITAALFLKTFVGDTPWVHLDIAGPAHQSRARGTNPQGASGVGVRTLVQWVVDRAAPADDAAE